MKKRMRKYDFGRFMRHRGINTRIVAKLLFVSKETARQWKQNGEIPIEYLPELRALTKKNTEPERKWAEYDLAELRDALGASKTDMADLLTVNLPSINYWEKRLQVPRRFMPRIRELERESRE